MSGMVSVGALIDRHVLPAVRGRPSIRGGDRLRKRSESSIGLSNNPADVTHFPGRARRNDSDEVAQGGSSDRRSRSRASHGQQGIEATTYRPLKEGLTEMDGWTRRPQRDSPNDSQGGFVASRPQTPTQGAPGKKSGAPRGHIVFLPHSSPVFGAPHPKGRQ